MSRLWKVGYLVSERHNASFKDGDHLSKLRLGLSKDCLCIVTYVFLGFCLTSLVSLSNSISPKKINLSSKNTPIPHPRAVCSSCHLQSHPHRSPSSPKTAETRSGSTYCPHSKSPALPPEYSLNGGPPSSNASIAQEKSLWRRGLDVHACGPGFECVFNLGRI